MTTDITVSNEVDSGMVSNLHFYHKLYQEIGDFFGTDFNWNNTFIAGSFISALLSNKITYSQYSDIHINMFVCCEKYEQLRDRLLNILLYIQNKADDVIFTINGERTDTVIDCFIKGLRRKLQIIGKVDYKNYNILDILKTFEFTHNQIAFNGKNIIMTDEFIDTMKTKITKINSNINWIQSYRFVNLFKLGYYLAPREHQIHIINSICHNSLSFGTDNYNGHLPDFPILSLNLSKLLHDPIVLENYKYSNNNMLVNFKLNGIRRLQKIACNHDYISYLMVFNKFGNQVLSIEKHAEEPKYISCNTLTYSNGNELVDIVCDFMKDKIEHHSS